MKWVRTEIEANRIEAVTIRRDPNTGAIGLLVKWHGPGLILSHVDGKTLEDCFSNLERIQLPSETWAAKMQKRQQSTPSAVLSFDAYLKSLGVER